MKPVTRSLLPPAPTVLRTGLALARLALACALAAPSDAQACLDTPGNVGLTPLDDLGPGTYSPQVCVGASTPCPVQGGLYGNGSNCIPAQHGLDIAGQAALVAPVAGGSGPKIVMLGLGASTASQQFAAFERLADSAGFASGLQHHPELLLVNGGEGGTYAQAMSDPDHPIWTDVEERLTAVGATRDQVQVVWLHQVYGDPPPPAGFPKTAVEFKDEVKQIVQDLVSTHYPNVKLCLIPTRVFGGYSVEAGSTGKEPIPYQGSFSLRELIAEQIDDPAGNQLTIGSEAPALYWGPYSWADGNVPRVGMPGCSTHYGRGLASSVGAGLTWLPGDFAPDCLHLSTAGAVKGATLLYDFASQHESTIEWFSPDCSAGSLVALEAIEDTYIEDGQSGPLGSLASLKVDDGQAAEPERRAFVKFDLSAMGATPVVHAKLSLRNAPESPAMVELNISTMASSWNEATLVWGQEPASNAPLGIAPGTSSGSSRAIEVTTVVNAAIASGDPFVSFAFDALPVTTGTAELLTREAADPPRLILRTAFQTPENYCTAGVSTYGCQATLSTSGTASATARFGFDLTAAQVEGNRSGQFLFGINGRQANPWGSGSAISYQCIVPPVTRGGLLGPDGTHAACDGTITQDLNALWCPSCPSPNKNPGPGVQVQAQYWFRSPNNPNSNQSTSFSDAIEFTTCP